MRTNIDIDDELMAKAMRASGKATKRAEIATFCLLNGHTLLHDDRDYDAFEEELGLAVVHP